MGSIRKHLTYANVVSTLCLFVLLGGVAAAVDGPNPGQNTVGSEDIIGNEVKSDDIGNGRIFNLDIADEIITGAKLKDETVTGDDIAYGSVPRSDLESIERWHYVGDAGEPQFMNGWVNYSAGSHSTAVWQHAAYAKDDLGNVYVRGLVKNGTVNQPIFRLPSGYCGKYFHTVSVISNDAPAQIVVEYLNLTNDHVGCSVIPRTGSSAWVSLDGTTFQEYWVEARLGTSEATAAPVGDPPRGYPPRATP